MDKSPWKQINIMYPGQRRQEREHHALDHLNQVISKAETTGLITAWWFIRKGLWRIRYQLASPNTRHDPAQQLLTAGVSWTGCIYEPETHAFGGAQAMSHAHELFCSDSRNILRHLTQTRTAPDHRREISIRLATIMMNAAGQDWYEQGDVWSRIVEQRATTSNQEPSSSMIYAVGKLITAAKDSPDSPLTKQPAWPVAFENTGHTLAELAQRGQLTRGIRAVLTHHLLFAFNRLGIPSHQQYLLARSAAQKVFHSTQ